jgi:hypothetical protein
MRKRILTATAAIVALLAFLPMVTASAATQHAVLTISKVGGPNVRANAVLQASVKSGTKVTFFTPGTKNGVSCKSASFTDKVTSNPLVPGLARELLNKQTFSKCSISGVPGATGVKSIAVLGLPYKTTVSSSDGHQIVLSKASTKLTLNTVIGTVNCTYSAPSVKGTWSNTGQVNKFANQTFTLSSGPAACPKKGNFSATFGPVRDVSVTNHPAVFVN